MTLEVILPTKPSLGESPALRMSSVLFSWVSCGACQPQQQREKCVTWSDSVLRNYTACRHSPQRYDTGVDSHKIRLASNIFSSIPCDWGEVAPGIKKEKKLKIESIKADVYTHTYTHTRQLLQLPGKPVRISYLPELLLENNKKNWTLRWCFSTVQNVMWF